MTKQELIKKLWDIINTDDGFAEDWEIVDRITALLNEEELADNLKKWEE